MLRAAAEALDLEHYLDALSKKPGALAGSMPLEQCRAQGRWPDSFDRFWGKLEHRHGKQDGTRAMMDVLLLGREHGFERLRAVVEQALEMGVSDVAAIRYLLELERSGETGSGGGARCGMAGAVRASAAHLI